MAALNKFAYAPFILSAMLTALSQPAVSQIAGGQYYIRHSGYIDAHAGFKFGTVTVGGQEVSSDFHRHNWDSGALKVKSTKFLNQTESASYKVGVDQVDYSAAATAQVIPLAKLGQVLSNHSVSALDATVCSRSFCVGTAAGAAANVSSQVDWGDTIMVVPSTSHPVGTTVPLHFKIYIDAEEAGCDPDSSFHYSTVYAKFTAPTLREIFTNCGNVTNVYKLYNSEIVNFPVGVPFLVTGMVANYLGTQVAANDPNGPSSKVVLVDYYKNIPTTKFLYNGKIQSGTSGKGVRFYIDTTTPKTSYVTASGNTYISKYVIPTFARLSKSNGLVGSTVDIYGNGFIGSNLVQFNGVNATFKVVNDTRIQTKVPPGATTGKITIRNPKGQAISSIFKVN